MPPSLWDEESEDEQNDAVALAENDDIPYSLDKEDDQLPHLV